MNDIEGCLGSPMGEDIWIVVCVEGSLYCYCLKMSEYILTRGHVSEMRVRTKWKNSGELQEGTITAN